MDDPTTPLKTLLEYHETAAAALRAYFAITNGAGGNGHTNGQSRGTGTRVYVATRRGKRRKPRKPAAAPTPATVGASGKTRPAQDMASRKAQRERSATFLAQFVRTEPRAAGEGAKQYGLGALVRRGYLRAKGDGYIRTAKEYTI